MDFEQLGRDISNHWGRHIYATWYSSDPVKLTGIVYEAFRVSFTPVGELLHVEVDALDPYPATLPSQDFTAAELPRVLEELDATVRAALPPTFVAALEEAIRLDLIRDAALKRPGITWDERRAINTARRPERDATPQGPPLTTADLRNIITDYYGTRAVVEPHNPERPDNADATLDNRVHFGFNQERRLGTTSLGLGGYINFNGRVISPFSRSLSGRYNDERSARQLLDRIDEWYRIRTGEQTTIPADI